MAWIESHTALLRHRKTLLVAHDLGIPPVQVIGHLTALWHTVLEQQEDGDLSDWPDNMIEEAACWEGVEPGKFVATLRSRGWLDGHLIHDWLDYVGAYLVVRYHSSNPEKLVAIWAVHGYKYGESKGKKTRGSKKLPNLTVPHQEESPSVSDVVDAWNSTQGLVPAQFVTGSIKKKVECRLREHKDISWFHDLFQRVARSDFLAGRKSDFCATLDWVLSPRNLDKILNGNYDNRSVVTSPVMRGMMDFIGREHT